MSVKQEAVAAASRKSTGFGATVALVLGSVLFSLVVLEVGVRLLRSDGMFDFSNFARKRMSIVEEGDQSCAYAWDATLGWTGPAKCVSPGYNFLHGFRGMPPATGAAEPPVLVTGSSFAFGQEVEDDQSWPAYLQGLVGRRVINAGIGGYSLDQTVLRTERLVPEIKPLFVVAGFTPDDIRRTELSVSWSRAKPYFAVVDGKLELRNVPVPGRPGESVRLPTLGRLLGWSALADEIVQRFGWQIGWFFDETQAVPSGTGEAISCLLMSRLAGLGVPVAVVAQYNRIHWTSDEAVKERERRAVRKVLACAADAGVIPIDLSDSLKPAVDAKGIDSLFQSNHHSAEGNRTVADLVRDELVRQRLLP